MKNSVKTNEKGTKNNEGAKTVENGNDVAKIAQMGVQGETAKTTQEPEPQETKQPEENRQVVYVPKMSVEQRLKLVDDLNRLRLQRENLIMRKNQLEAFEIAVSEEADELESNQFQRCTLAIMDDNGRQFTVKSPGLIKMVAAYIHNACEKAINQIEEAIIFPAA